MAEHLIILGAGLVGSLVARRLAQAGYSVTILEKRRDMRREKVEAGRSINLALAERGREALRRAGILDSVEPLLVTMRGRMVHALDEDTSSEQPISGDRVSARDVRKSGTSKSAAPRFQAYGQRPEEVIYSISRGDLNRVLMDAAEEVGVRIRFGQSCQSIDLDRRRLTLHDEEGGTNSELEFEVLVGADGAGSLVRDAIAERLGTIPERMQLGHAYKELTIPPLFTGGHRMEREALHIWPRGGFMLIALPNQDGSFTVTLFAPLEVLKGLDADSLRTGENSVVHFFETHFPDTLPHLPHLAVEFCRNPTSSLSTVRCWPWHFQGRALILGDAAHAIVPFHGQGMNCGFEDCEALLVALEQSHGDWEHASRVFAESRKPNADAIAEMAIQNYVVMRDQVRDPKFALRQEVELALERRVPDRFVPRYSMVMFHHVPYAEALRRGEIQSAFVSARIAHANTLREVDLETAAQHIAQTFTPIPGLRPREQMPVTKAAENALSRIALIGVGLIGGSLGLAIQQRGIAKEVIGIGRDREGLFSAKHAGLITHVAENLSAGVADADLTIVCTPLGSVVEMVRQAMQVGGRKEMAIFTDVGSAKGQIVRELESILPDSNRFIGSHPFAGGHTSGIQGARGDLFLGQSVVITPTSRSAPDAVHRLAEFWRGIGATVIEMSAEAHDAAAAMVSHLPHVLASALARATPAEYLALVAGSWRDGTRVAASSTEIWRDILLSNRASILAALGEFETGLADWKAVLQAADARGIESLWNLGREIRNVVGD